MIAIAPDWLWARVRVGSPNECWDWECRRDKNGYGDFTRREGGKVRHYRAHRVAHRSRRSRSSSFGTGSAAQRIAAKNNPGRPDPGESEEKMSTEIDDQPDCAPTEHQPYCRKYKPPETAKMSNKTWIPPGMRACTWDEAQWFNRDGSVRMGMDQEDIYPHPYAKRGEAFGIVWLCIDTSKPQHTHPEPWRECGFERCTVEDAAFRSPGEFPIYVGWNAKLNAPYSTTTLDSEYSGAPIRPSAEKGLREAVEWLLGHSMPRLAAELEAHVNTRYPPPVCSECGRAR